MIIKRKYLFLSIYFISMFCLFLSISDLCPMQGIFQKMKYLLIIFCLFDMMAHYFTYNHLNKSVMFIFVTYVFFCILYGKIWVTPVVYEETAYQFKITIIMLFMIFLVYYEVEYYKCFELFMHVSFIAIGLFLLLSYIANIGESSFNPLYVVKFLFNSDARGRARFGLQHWNYIGFYVYIELVLSVFCYKYASIMGRFTNIYRCVIAFVDYIMYLMLISASSRAGLLSFVLFGCFIILFKFILRVNPNDRLILGIGLLIVVIIGIIVGINTGLFAKVWSNSSRGLNISINMPIFHEYGNFWKGMGWVENAALQDSVDAFGLGTSSLDMFYVYIFFTTGFIGCVFMGIVYGTIGIFNFLNFKSDDGYYYVSLFLSLLFYLYWETFLFTINCWPGLILIIILFHGMGKKNKPYFR